MWKPLLHDKVNQELTRKHPQVGHTKMKKTRKHIKTNINNLLLHHDKRTTTSTMKKIMKKNKMKKKFNEDPSKSFHEFEQELPKIIPSSKFTMIFQLGELLAQKLV